MTEQRPLIEILEDANESSREIMYNAIADPRTDIEFIRDCSDARIYTTVRLSRYNIAQIDKQKELRQRQNQYRPLSDVGSAGYD